MIGNNTNVGGAVLVIPSGRCPHILEGTDIESVEKWVNAVRKSKPPGMKYLKSVYQYWIRDSYDVNSGEFKEATKSLNMLLDEYI